MPAIRRLDNSGRVLWDALTDALGWTPTLALEVRLGPGRWVSFSSAGHARRAEERRLAHLDKVGRLVVRSQWSAQR